MIPQEVVDVLRNQVDVSLDNYGISCTLYLPTNTSYDTAEKLDVFAEPEDLSFTSYSAKVFIEWQPTAYRLKKLGLFVEGNLPILAWFGNKATALDGSEAGQEVDVDIVRLSYFTINPEFIPNNYIGVEQFEILNPIIKGMHDMVIMQGYSIAPRRIKI
jgi:hypothetical protein